MGLIGIPEERLSGFQYISRITTEDAEKIAQVLSKADLNEGPPGIISTLVDTLPIDGIIEIAESIISTAPLFSGFPDASERAATFVDSYKSEMEDNDRTVSDKELKTLRTNLEIIWKHSSNLLKIYKLTGLVRHAPHLYRKSRIVSDIRLIFDADVKGVDRAGIVLHSVGLKYFSDDMGNKSETFYATLTGQDLIRLREQIDRALQKESAIKADFPNVTFIGLEKEETT